MAGGCIVEFVDHLGLVRCIGPSVWWLVRPSVIMHEHVSQPATVLLIIHMHCIFICIYVQFSIRPPFFPALRGPLRLGGPLLSSPTSRKPREPP